ncbi:M23 family metallopeptidase, partial [Shewanella sp. A25]|nr:M23 family metallopeptidase [Shewanella shenzhenensis]
APASIEYRLVWEGADVDGDGKADFANPTGHEPRTEDTYGSGAFGASRDGGVRRHEGVDFRAAAGQSVVAPLSGYVTRIGYAYAGDDDLKFVE